MRCWEEAGSEEREAFLILLDNATAQTKSQSTTTLHVKDKSLDMLHDIHVKISKLPLEIEFFWVEGHALEKKDLKPTKNN